MVKKHSPATLGGRIGIVASKLAGVDAVAAALDVSRTAVYDWINERSEPTASKIEGMAVLAGCSIEWLVTGRGPAPLSANEKPYEQVVARIKKRLSDLQLEPESASTEAGFEADYLQRIISGGLREFRTDRIKRIATALQCSASWLLTGEGRFDAPEPETLEETAVWRAVREIAERPGVTTLDPSGLADLVVNLAVHLQSKEAADVDNIVQFGTDSLRRKQR